MKKILMVIWAWLFPWEYGYTTAPWDGYKFPGRRYRKTGAFEFALSNKLETARQLGFWHPADAEAYARNGYVFTATPSAWARWRAKRAEWEAGVCWSGNRMAHGRKARRSRKTGAVQFRLWEGRAPDDETAWVNYDRYWWPNFKPESEA